MGIGEPSLLDVALGELSLLNSRSHCKPLQRGLKVLKVRARAERVTHRNDICSSECLGKEIEMIAHANKFVSKTSPQ